MANSQLVADAPEGEWWRRFLGGVGPDVSSVIACESSRASSSRFSMSSSEASMASSSELSAIASICLGGLLFNLFAEAARLMAIPRLGASLGATLSSLMAVSGLSSLLSLLWWMSLRLGYRPPSLVGETLIFLTELTPGYWLVALVAFGGEVERKGDLVDLDDGLGDDLSLIGDLDRDRSRSCSRSALDTCLKRLSSTSMSFFLASSCWRAMSLSRQELPPTFSNNFLLVSKPDPDLGLRAGVSLLTLLTFLTLAGLGV